MAHVRCVYRKMKNQCNRLNSTLSRLYQQCTTVLYLEKRKRPKQYMFSVARIQYYFIRFYMHRSWTCSVYRKYAHSVQRKNEHHMLWMATETESER